MKFLIDAQLPRLLFDRNMPQLEQVLATSAFVELSCDALIVHV